MNEAAFNSAKEKLTLAREKLEEMKASADLERLILAWSEFLTETQRVFTRLRKATELGPSKGWFDKVLNQRTDDDMLSYVLHARNADEHGIDRITRIHPGGVGLNFEGGYVEHLEIGRTGRGTNINYRGPNRMHVHFVPANVALVAVRDRGITYQPPKQHLGQSLAAVTPLAVAELTFAYLDNLINEAAAKFS